MVSNSKILSQVFSVALFVSLVFMSVSDCLSNETKAEALSKIKKQAEPIKTLFSCFTQVKHLSMFEKDLNSTGKFYYQKPDCLRWEYVNPYEQGFVMCAEQGVKWDEISGEQTISVSENPLWATLSKQLIAWSNLDMDWLQKKYNIKIVQNEPLVLELVPKSEGMGQVFNRLIIKLKKNKGLIREIVLHEKGADWTKVLFEDTEINKNLPSNIFSGK